LRLTSKAAFTAAILAVMAGPATARPVPQQPESVSGRSALIQEAGVAEKKAATKSWFKRKGNQTSNWFKRQKNKVEKKLAD
jgi:hypothetical protein